MQKLPATPKGTIIAAARKAEKEAAAEHDAAAADDAAEADDAAAAEVAALQRDHLDIVAREMEEAEKHALEEASQAAQKELADMGVLDPATLPPPEPAAPPPLPPPEPPLPPPPPPVIKEKAMPVPPPVKAKPKAPWQSKDEEKAPDKSWHSWWQASHEVTPLGRKTSWQASSSWKHAPDDDHTPKLCLDGT